MPDTLSERVARCETQIETLQKDQDAIKTLATSVAVMAAEQKTTNEKIDTVCEKVENLEKVPTQRWNGLVEKVLFGVVGALITWLASMVLK